MWLSQTLSMTLLKPLYRNQHLVPAGPAAGGEQSLHLPGEAGSEDGREHKVVGGEQAPVKQFVLASGVVGLVVSSSVDLPVKGAGDGL